MKIEDVELIHHILAGDESAFVLLVERYQKQVHALVWRKIGDFHIAEEITQDTFLKVHQKLSTLKNPNQFSGWLYVIATRECLSWLRKKKIETESLEESENEWIDESAYSQYIVEEHAKARVDSQREVVKKLLAKLKDSERTVMTLHYLGEMTVEEISRFLGVSTSAIKIRLHRARQRLQKEETMIREVLRNFQLSPNLTENIIEKMTNLQPTSPTSAKPFIPWMVGASTVLLIMLLFGMGSKHLSRFQQPYSLESQSEFSVEMVDTPITQDIEAEPDIQNQLGVNSDNQDSGNGTGEESNQVLSDEGNYTQWNLPVGAKARLSKGSISDISFSPDGAQIAAASATGIWIYDTHNGTSQALLTDHVTRCELLTFSPDGKFLATGMRENILLWDISSGKLLKSLNGFDNRLVKIRFFEDGKSLLCVYSDGTACLWDVNTNVKKEFLDSSSGVIAGTLLTLRGITVSEGDIYLDDNHNGIFAIGYDNGEIRLEDVTTGQHLRTLQGGNNLIFSLRFSPDGTLLFAYIPNEPLRLWDVTTGELLKTFTRPKFSRYISFSKDSKTLVFKTQQDEIELWDVHTKTLRTVLHRKLDIDIDVLAFSPDSKTIAGSTGDGKIHIWDVNTGDKMSSFSTEHVRRISMLKYSHDESMLACRSGNKIRFWGTRNLTPLPNQIDVEFGLNTFAFSRDDNVLTLAKGFNYRKVIRNEFVRESVLGGLLSVWNKRSGSRIAEYHINVHKGDFPNLPGLKRTGFLEAGTKGMIMFSQNGYMLATVVNTDGAAEDSRFNVVLWEVPDGKLSFWLKGHTDKINALAFTPNGYMLASGSDDGTIRVWNTSTGTEMRSLPSDNTLFLAFSKDGRILASRNKDGTIYLWDITTGKQLNSIEGSEPGRNVIAISIDNKTLASGNSNGVVDLWDIATGDKLYTLQGHTGPINSLTFSSDGKTLVSGDNYGAIFLWDLNSKSGINQHP